jgi:hypothetical protein
MRAREEPASRYLSSPTQTGRLFHHADGIEVDFNALHHFAMTLQVLASELGQHNGTLVSGLADPDLADAFSHAEHDWSQQRRRLGAFLDGAAGAVSAGLAGYREVEAELARAATIPGPG